MWRKGFGDGVPSVDVLEKNGNLIFKVELPGMDEKDIQLQVEGNMLTIKGERKLENEEDRKNYHRMESFYGSFARSFTLPDTVNLEKVKAKYKNGILEITVPQRPEVLKKG
jgi:HSP20 family protein